MKFLLAFGALACALATSTASTTLMDIPFKTAKGTDATLKDFPGKAILIVNVASKCGNTPQYAALEELSKKYGPQGLVILGFPCNDFGNQEPGSTEEIQKFCTLNYGVTFPILEKIHVKGSEQAPLYAALSGPEAKFPGDVKWNFGKFLIGKDGTVIARFEPKTLPDDAEVVSAIEASLK